MTTRLHSARRVSFLLLFFLCVNATIVHAKTVIYVDGQAGEDNNGTSWKNAYNDLQDAFASATSGDEIWVAEGSYYPDRGEKVTGGDRAAAFNLIDGVAVYGGFPTGGSAAPGRDPVAYPTILSGDLNQDDDTGGDNGENASHVLLGDFLSSATILDGFTITAGNADGASPDNIAGGLFLGRSSPTLSNCSFSGNSAAFAGGGILNSDSSPTFTNCTFSANGAAYGGGIYNANGARPSFTNCSFLGNDAGDNGGGVYSIGSASSAAFTNCTFSGNDATRFGGGVHNENSASASLTNCIVWNNRDNSGQPASWSTSGGGYTYSYCLVQGLDLTGTNGLDGTVAADNDPLFLLNANPNLAPSTRGALRLSLDSPAIDMGDDGANGETTDLAGDARFQGGAIDLGAYERRPAMTLFVDGTAGSPNDGTSWDRAYLTLQDALAATFAGDEIWVAEGTYYPDEGADQADGERSSAFQLVEGVIIYGGFPDDGSATQLSDRDADAYPTILSGDLEQDDGTGGDNSDNAYHVLLGDSLTAATTLDGFTITAGNADGAAPYDRGGGFYLEGNSELTLSDCTFLDNTAANRGGGIYIDNSTPALTGCIFSGNHADTNGGGIYIDKSTPILNSCSFSGNNAGGSGGGISNNRSSPTLSNCSFSVNSAGDGGGVYNVNGSSPTLSNCSFSGNSAGGSGGAISNDSSSAALSSCIFSGNSAGAGGGIANSSSSPTLISCSFSGNNADTEGGGIANSSSSSPTLTSCSFSGNRAGDGGGISNDSSSVTLTNCSFSGNDVSGDGGGISNESSSVTLSNCSFSGNNVSDDGGGIYNRASSAILTNCTFSGNDADGFGGGICNRQSPTTTLTNCIVWNNRDDSGTGTADSSTYTSLGSVDFTYSHCLVQGRDLTGTNGLDGLSSINDPLFALAVNSYSAPSTGGDLRLLGGSPAFDVGDNAANTEATDLAGNTRIRNGTIDLGAYEKIKFILVDATATAGANDGISWNTAYTTLHDAFAVASAGDQIWVAEGTYYPDVAGLPAPRKATFQLKEEVEIYGGFPNGGGAIRDPDANPTILSGDLAQNDSPLRNNTSENAHHVLQGDSTITAATILDGFTITAGNANGSPPYNRGGGLELDNSSPTLINCIFSGNSTTFGGGGIYSVNNSSPTLINCSFSGNSADNGGGVYSNSSSPTLTNCTFSGNNADSNGGGVYNLNSSLATLINCSFSGNNADANGGGIYNFNSSSATLSNCIVWNNRDSSGTGTADSSTSGSGYSFSHCLVQGRDLTGTGSNNFDGSVDPLFLVNVDPTSAPTTGGDLRLSNDSPALDVGDNTSNSEATDLAGDTRILDVTIDLGAYENGFASTRVTFSGLYPTLNPNNDENNNGVTNYGDYAAGGDPTAPDDPSLRPQINGTQLTFSYRNNASDVFVEFQKSNDLATWSKMSKGVDYAADPGEIVNLVHTLITFDLLTTGPMLLFREEFTETAP